MGGEPARPCERHADALRAAGCGDAGDGARRPPRGVPGGAGAERGRPRPDDHPGQREPPRAGADGDRHRGEVQDQREHRQQPDRQRRGRRAGQAARLPQARRRHGDRPLHRRRHPAHPRRAPAPQYRAARHRAHLRGHRARQAGRGADCARPAGHRRGAGEAGRGLHDHPRRDPARLPPARAAPHHRHRLARRRADGPVDDGDGEGKPLVHALRRPVRDLQGVRRELQPGRLAAARLPGRRLRRGAVRRAARAGRADPAGLGARRAGDDRGPRPRADGPDRDEHEDRAGGVPRGALLRAGPLGHGHRARLRPHHQRNRRGAGRLARRLDALLRHARGASLAAQRRGRAPGDHRLQDRRARGRRGAPAGRSARPRRRALPCPLRLRLARAVPAVARPRGGPGEARRDAAARRLQDGRVLRHVRPEVLLDEGAHAPGRQGPPGRHRARRRAAGRRVAGVRPALRAPAHRQRRAAFAGRARPQGGGRRGRGQAPDRRGARRHAAVRPAHRARAPPLRRAALRAVARRGRAPRRRAAGRDGAGAGRAQADRGLQLRHEEEARPRGGPHPRARAALPRRAVRRRGRGGQAVAHRPPLGPGAAGQADGLPHLARPGGGGAALYPPRGHPQGPPGGARDAARGDGGGPVAVGRVRPARGRRTRRPARAELPAVIGRQAGALVWLRATLWRRRLFQQREWGRLAISLLGVGMGAVLGVSTALLLVRYGEQLRNRPQLVAEQGGALALFATWLTSALLARVWFAFLPRGQTPFLDPRRFLAFAVPARLVSALNFAAQLFDPAWLFFWPILAGIAWAAGRLPGMPGAGALLCAEALSVWAVAGVLHLAAAIGGALESRLMLRRAFSVVLALLAAAGVQLATRPDRPGIPSAFAAEHWTAVAFTPPGWAAEMVRELAGGRPQRAVPPALLLFLLGAVCGVLAHRLSLREALRPVESGTARAGRRSAGWRLPLVPEPVSAVLEKEAKTVLRIGWLQIVLVPIGFLLLRVVFLDPRGGSWVERRPLLFAAVYAHLGVLELATNLFGRDLDAARGWFLWPVSPRVLVAAKNLVAYALSLCIFAGLVVVARATGPVSAEQRASPGRRLPRRGARHGRRVRRRPRRIRAPPRDAPGAAARRAGEG